MPKRVLIVHSSYDGQTVRIAEKIAAVLREKGHLTTVRPAAAIGDRIPHCDAIVIGAAIRYGHHSHDLEKLVRAQRQVIESRPNAFFSVCLSAGGPSARPATAAGYVEDFVRTTHWQPQLVASMAGALQYSRYGFYIRIMMRLIMRMTGGVTDPSSDYEYTDWAAVERYAGEFAARLGAPQTAEARV